MIGSMLRWLVDDPASALAVVVALVVLLALLIERGLGWVQRRLHCSCRRRVR